MGFALKICARGSLARKNYQEVEHEKDWEEITGSFGEKNPMFMDLKTQQLELRGGSVG